MDNKVISCPQMMADMLAEQYNSVFSIPKENPISPSQGIFQCGSQLQDGRYISDIEFSVKNIEEAISEISATATAGPDRFPAILLKKCKSQLAKPLFIIWRTSMDSGVIPNTVYNQNCQYHSCSQGRQPWTGKELQANCINFSPDQSF